jgi:hypothetical protein
VCLAHGLPTDDREFSLGNKKMNSAPNTKTCPMCFAILRSNTMLCPCGHSFARSQDEDNEGRGAIEHVEGKLEELTAEFMDERKRFWAHLCEVVEERQYTAQWAAVKFKEKFKEYPPRSFPKPRGRPLTGEELATMRERLTNIAKAKNIPLSWVNKKVREAASPPDDAFSAGQLGLDEHRKRAYVPRALPQPIAEDDDDIPRDVSNDNCDDSFDFGQNARG